MIDTEKILASAGQHFVDEIKAQFVEFGLNATGQASDSLTFSVEGTRLEVQGKLRIVVLVTGRRGGKAPPSEKIKEWVRIKLGIKDEKQVKSVAFLITRKIAEKGTDIFTGKAKGLQFEFVINTINSDVFKKISEEANISIGQTILNQYKNGTNFS